MELKQPATISRSQIGPIHKLIGTMNSSVYSIGSVRHEANSLRFLGFRGAIDMKSRKYVGVLVFDTKVDDSCAESAWKEFKKEEKHG